MAEDIMLQEALEAIRRGQRIRARDLLTRLLRASQNSPTYWLYMSSVVDTQREQIFCLQNVLKVDPNNAAAQQGLILLGARVPEGAIIPAPLVRRKWDVEVQSVEELTGIRAVLSNPFVRVGLLTLAILAIFSLIVMGLYWQGMRRQVAVFMPTNTPGPSPTYTPTPTAKNVTPRAAPSATPTQAGPQPLWMRLEATYTPTPVYVNTPHAANEAFLIAQRALASGDLPRAMSNFDQAMQMLPDAPDIPYYMGEVYRQQGKYQDALGAYARSLAVNPSFAPALLGRARLTRLVDPKKDTLPDLNTAIQNDPNYLEAYLERADLLVSRDELDAAIADLDKIDQLRPDSAQAYLLRGQVALARGENEAALENARKANQLDQTNLASYRLLGQAAVNNRQYREAIEAINTYLLYEPNDPAAWMIKGESLFISGQYSQTLEALNQALRLDKKLMDAYYYRGLASLELGQGKQATNDIYYVMQSRPKDFKLNIAFGRALLMDNHLSEALGQIRRTLDMAQTDAQKAEAYYYRAQTYEAIGNNPTAIKDWKALLALPEEAVPAEWREIAEEHIKATVTPPAPTQTYTPTPKPKTNTPTPPAKTGTSTATRTPTRTPAPTG